MKLNRTQISLGLIVSVSILIGLITHEQLQRREPIYGGKSLTKWLKQLDDGQAFGISSHALPSPTTAQIEAAEAIRAIGPAALPLLMHDIHTCPLEDSFPFKAQRKLNALLPRNMQLCFAEVTEKDSIRWRAAQGLAALGPLVRPAVPELKRLLFTNYFHSSIKEAAYVLATVGPEGIDVLTNAVQHDEWSGMCAIWALGQHPAAGTNVIPFLISATSSQSEGTACGAIQVLGLFHIDGDRVIPALVAALTSAKLAVRNDAVRALGRFGPQAASALPQIQVLTNDPATRGNVLEALPRIDATTR